MILFRYAFIGLIGFIFLYGCAAVRPQTVTFCESRQCNTIKESDSKQELLGKLSKLIKKNLNRNITLYETPPGKIVGNLETASYFEKGFSFYVQGGRMPGVVDLESLFAYVRKNVSEKALVEFNRDQTPVLLPSESPDSKLKIPVSKTH